MSIKLNIGCGPNGQFPDFINIDNSQSIWISKFPPVKHFLHRVGVLTDNQLKDNWSGVMKCDASRRLPFPDASVAKIYSSHFLEHIPYSKAVKVLRECHRVLSCDGLLRLVVPDLLWHAERYVTGTREILAKNVMDRKVHDEFLETVYGAYLVKRRYGLSHCYMYDYPTLSVLLRSVGFGTVRVCDYRQGEDSELASFDSRPGESLHLEVRK